MVDAVVVVVLLVVVVVLRVVVLLSVVSKKESTGVRMSAMVAGLRGLLDVDLKG